MTRATTWEINKSTKYYFWKKTRMKLKNKKFLSDVIHLLTVLIFVCRRDFSVCQFGIQLTDANSKILGTFCARNERDRTKFVDDLKEAISEVKNVSACVILWNQFYTYPPLPSLSIWFPSQESTARGYCELTFLKTKSCAWKVKVLHLRRAAVPPQRRCVSQTGSAFSLGCSPSLQTRTLTCIPTAICSPSLSY